MEAAPPPKLRNDPDNPFRHGVAYEVINDYRPSRWGVEFYTGEVVVYEGRAGYTSEDFVGFPFSVLDKPGRKKDWAVEKNGIDLWQEYFRKVAAESDMPEHSD